MENNTPDERALVLTDSVQLGSMSLATPHDVIVRATVIAKELTNVIKDKKLSRSIGGKEHIYVDAWATLGAMLGVTPRQIPELSKLHEDGTCEEWVELVRVSDGAIIGRAKGICATDEPNWKSKPLYARSSMAATRATGKAFRLAFSWIVVLAGYAPAPVEEMDGIVDGVYRDAPPPAKKQEPPPAKASRPLAPEVLRDMLNKKAEKHSGKAVPADHNVMDILATVFGGSKEKAAEFFVKMFDAQGSNEAGRKLALWDWLAPELVDGGYIPSTLAIQEAKAALATL